MKGFFIIVFAICMFAFGKFCCEAKQPNTEHAQQSCCVREAGSAL